MNTPKVSVILTSYNHGKFIAEAIESVLSQSFTDFELIIWDDASTDESWDVINHYQDPRIKKYRNEKNERGSINKALQSGVVTGELVAIHHSDDVWASDKLQKQVEILDAAPEVAAVFTWVQIINEYGVPQENDWFNQDNKSQWQWLNGLFLMRNHFAHPSVLIRKQCYQELGYYNVFLAQTPDVEMWSRLLLKYPVYLLPQKLTKHRLFSNCSNTSGSRIDVAIRTANEWNLLRENFLSIDKFENLVATFPSLERFRNESGFNTKFLLAMICLSECSDRAAWHLGLTWLFDLIRDREQAEQIGHLYSFYYKDLVKLTGEVDVNALGDLAKRETDRDAALAERDSALAERDAALAERDAALAERVSALAERDAALAERDAALAERDSALAERDAALAERVSALAERDAALAERVSALAERDAALAERVSALAERDAALAERVSALAERDAILSSTSWRITQPIRATVSAARSFVRAGNFFRVFGLSTLTWTRLKKGSALLKNGNLSELKSALAFVLRESSKSKTRASNLQELIPTYPLPKDQPLVSVIVPCYNYGRFVLDALDSILAQTLKNVEIFVVDGGSTDTSTIETLKAIQRPRTTILFREGRHLVGDNRNFGIEKAKGRYICCLDADDTLDPTYLEKAVFYLETYGYDIVSTAINFVGAKNGHLDILEFPDLTDMVNGNHVLTCAVFRRRLWESLGGYVDIGIGKHHVAEDWDFWLRLTAKGARIRNISGEYLFNYRIHEAGSLSSAADVKSLSDQKESILERNREMLTPEAFRISATAQSRNLWNSPSDTALAISFNSTLTKDRKTLLLAIPFSLVGGAERLLSGLSRYLSANDWRVIVVTTLDQDDSFGNSIDWFKNISSEVYELPRFLSPGERGDFIDYLIGSRKPDCLLNAGSRLVYEMLPILKKNYKGLCVVDLLFNTVGHVESHLEYKKFFTFVLAENQEVFDWFINVAGWSTSRVRKMSSGVDLNFLRPSTRPKNLLDKYGIADDELVIGFSGRLSEEKAPDVFVKVAELCQGIANLRFVMTGAGPMTEDIIKRVDSLPSAVKFEFAGLVDDVNQYLGLYDVLILPSRIDGRPLVVMEALACGIPVIASNVGALPELIQDGKNGYLVPAAKSEIFADRVQTLAVDMVLLSRLKVGARRSAEDSLDANRAYRDYDTALLEAIEIKKVNV